MSHFFCAISGLVLGMAWVALDGIAPRIIITALILILGMVAAELDD